MHISFSQPQSTQKLPSTESELVSEAQVTSPSPDAHGSGTARSWSGARWADRVFEGFVGAAIVIELLVILINIGSRLFTGNSITWTQEISELAIYIVAFIGGAIAYG